jgi:hypothetical protein
MNFAGLGRLCVGVRLRIHLCEYGIFSGDNQDAGDSEAHVHQSVLAASLQGALEVGRRRGQYSGPTS